MPMHEYDSGMRECITHKTGRLRSRVMDRINCESDWMGEAEQNLKIAFRRFKTPLYLFLSACFLAVVLGAVLLFEGNFVAGASLLVCALAVAVFAGSIFHAGNWHFKQALKCFLEQELTFWKYANMLARSEHELGLLGWPIKYRGVWVVGVMEDDIPEAVTYEVRAVVKPDSESTPVDFLPRSIAEVNSFLDAELLIDKMYDLGELREIDGQSMLC